MTDIERRDFILSRLNLSKKQIRGLQEEDLCALIADLDQIRAESVEEGRYLDADNAKNKMKEVSKELEKKRKREMQSKQNLEKMKLDDEFEQELQGFAEFWNEKVFFV